MATYGYSTPYTGTRQPALPPGYMEAATAPGRYLAAGISQLGAGIGQAIQQYQKNKDENDYLNSKIEAGLAQYAQAGMQGPLPSGATADLQNLTGIVGEKSLKKFMEGTATKGDKLAMAHALETYGQKELQSLNRQLIQSQLDAASRKQITDEQIASLTRYGFNLPQEQTLLEPRINVSQETLYPVGPMPSNWPAQAQEQPRTPYVQRAQEPTIQSTGIPIGGLDQFAQVGRRFGQIQQPPPTQPQPQPSRAPEFMAPVQVPTQTTEMVKTRQEIPYSDLRQNLVNFATQSGMGTEAFGAIDKILEAAGRQKPMRVESQQLPGGAMVIRADNKIEILPPAKPVEGKDLTESQALSAGFAARMAYNNKVIDDTIKSGYTPKELTEFGWMPDRFKTQSRKSYESAKSNWIAAQLRKESGAAIGPMEYEQADIQYFPQPGDSKDVIQQKAELRKVAERTMKAAVGRNSDFYIQQILGGAQEAQFPQGPGTYRLVRGKEIQPIQ